MLSLQLVSEASPSGLSPAHSILDVYGELPLRDTHAPVSGCEMVFLYFAGGSRDSARLNNIL